MEQPRVDPERAIPETDGDASKFHHCLPLAVSPKEAARLAGVGRSTLYIALASGELKSSKIGKRRLVLIAELQRWIESHEIAELAVGRAAVVRNWKATAWTRAGRRLGSINL